MKIFLLMNPPTVTAQERKVAMVKNKPIFKGQSQTINAELRRDWRYEKWETIERALYGYIARSAEEKQGQRYMRIRCL